MSNATPPAPTLSSIGVDPAVFGEIEKVPLTRIQRLVGAHLANSWSSIPHVTQHDEIDVTELESLRKSLGAEHGIRVTTLAFCIKAVAGALKRETHFNASLEPGNANLILKKYVHIGFAVDTRNGLLVPVIRDCDTRSVAEIAAEIAQLSTRARDKGLPLTAMQGSCFSVSSLGRMGGTGFTPIINSPEVAILGLAAQQERPVRAADNGLAWRLMLPVSLSYDHRVINGVDAARFVMRLKTQLAEPRSLWEGSAAHQQASESSGT